MMRGILIAFAVLVLPAKTGIAQEPLGRLFFTAEQRSMLDARRNAGVLDQDATTAGSPTTRLDGYVKRSGGKSTVWVNGRPIPEAAADAPRIGDARVAVPIGESRTSVGLKPGETLDRGTGRVRDVIGDGEIRVRPSR